MIQEELPILLGFEHCRVFMHNENRCMLYSIVLDEEGDKSKMANGPPGFERDFIVEHG
jgi:hypothetical protein